jgi:hypothetical protein
VGLWAIWNSHQKTDKSRSGRWDCGRIGIDIRRQTRAEVEGGIVGELELASGGRQEQKWKVGLWANWNWHQEANKSTLKGGIVGELTSGDRQKGTEKNHGALRRRRRRRMMMMMKESPKPEENNGIGWRSTDFWPRSSPVPRHATSSKARRFMELYSVAAGSKEAPD